MDARDRRSNKWQGWLALVAVAALCGADTAWGADTASSTAANQSAAQPPAALSSRAAWGTWRRHRVQFNCLRCGSPDVLLQLRLSNLLKKSGARLNAPVIFADHGGLDYAELDYSTLEPVDSDTETTAIRDMGGWQSVRFQLNLGSMDQTTNPPCLLLYYFQTEVLQTFAVRRLSAYLPCRSFIRTPSYHLAFEVFAPVPGQG